MTRDELIRRLRECEGRNENFQKVEPAPAPRGGRGGSESFQEPAPSPAPPRAQRRGPPVTPLDEIRGYSLLPEVDAPSEVPESNQYFRAPSPSPAPSPSGPSINGPSYRGRKPRPGDAFPRGGGDQYRGPSGIDKGDHAYLSGAPGLMTADWRDSNRNGIDDRDEENRRRELDEIYRYIEGRRNYGYPRNGRY